MHACEQQLFAARWLNGFQCPGCGHNQYYKIQERTFFKCLACRHQTSLTAGTILHKTRTPLTTWFWTLFLVAHDKPGISVAAVSRELEVSYKTAWLLLRKIRPAMQKRDEHRMLQDIEEMHEAYFGGPGQDPKPGRGTNMASVLVGMGLTSTGKPKYLKMVAVANVNQDTIKRFVDEKVDPNATIVNDGFAAYRGIAKTRRTLTMKLDPVNNPDHMEWAHKAISNAKAFIQGTYPWYQGQTSADVLGYRYNRRNSHGQWFGHLLTAAFSTKTKTFPEITT